jgi:hypothetical protein
MSDADSDADSISDPSGAHVDTGGNEALISSFVRVTCDRLRANDPRVNSSFFADLICRSEAGQIAVFQALMENTKVKCIRLLSNEFTKRSAKVAAKYLKSSKTLQTISLFFGLCQHPHDIRELQEIRELISIFFRALSRKTSVTKLITNIDVVRFGCVAFQEFLTCTQTLQELKILASDDGDLNELQTAAAASGFANNTTLRNLELKNWRAADLGPVLKVLRDHAALQKLHLTADLSHGISFVCGVV